MGFFQRGDDFFQRVDLSLQSSLHFVDVLGVIHLTNSQLDGVGGSSHSVLAVYCHILDPDIHSLAQRSCGGQGKLQATDGDGGAVFTDLIGDTESGGQVGQLAVVGILHHNAHADGHAGHDGGRGSNHFDNGGSGGDHMGNVDIGQFIEQVLKLGSGGKDSGLTLLDPSPGASDDGGLVALDHDLAAVDFIACSSAEFISSFGVGGNRQVALGDFKGGAVGAAVGCIAGNGHGAGAHFDVVGIGRREFVSGQFSASYGNGDSGLLCQAGIGGVVGSDHSVLQVSALPDGNIVNNSGFANVHRLTIFVVHEVIGCQVGLDGVGISPQDAEFAAADRLGAATLGAEFHKLATSDGDGARSVGNYFAEGAAGDSERSAIIDADERVLCIGKNRTGANGVLNGQVAAGDVEGILIIIHRTEGMAVQVQGEGALHFHLTDNHILQQHQLCIGCFIGQSKGLVDGGKVRAIDGSNKRHFALGTKTVCTDLRMLANFAANGADAIVIVVGNGSGFAANVAGSIASVRVDVACGLGNRQIIRPIAFTAAVGVGHRNFYVDVFGAGVVVQRSGLVSP